MEEQKEYQTLEEVLIEAMQKYHEPELLEDLVNTYRCAKSVQLSKLNFGKGLKSTLPLLVILPRPVINQNKSLSDSE